jgi:hypothetical protein
MPGSAFRSRRLGHNDTSAAKPTGHNSIDWGEGGDGSSTGGSHLNADILGYSAEDYLHSREQLVKLVDQGLKPPPSLFVQLEACAHKMSEEDLRDEYKWFVYALTLTLTLTITLRSSATSTSGWSTATPLMNP